MSCFSAFTARRDSQDRCCCFSGIARAILALRAEHPAGLAQQDVGARAAIRPLAELVAGRLGARAAAPWAPGTGLRAWGEGRPELFRLRCGPDYKARRQKTTPGPALYRCTGAEVVRGAARIPSALASWSADARSLDGPHGERAAGLPRFLVVNIQLPFQAGPAYGEHPPEDAGCSVLLFFEVEPHTLGELSKAGGACAAVRLFAEYLRETEHPLKEGNQVSRCLKVVGYIDDLESLRIPAFARPLVERFNGKPVLTEKECRRYVTDAADVVELAVDVRGFNPVARALLCKLRGQLRQTSVHFGLLLQGCRDEELPEGFLGCVHLEGMDFEAGGLVGVAGAPPFARTPAAAPGSFLARAFRRLCPSRRAGAGRPASDGGDAGDGGCSTQWATPRSRSSSGL